MPVEVTLFEQGAVGASLRGLVHHPVPVSSPHLLKSQRINVSRRLNSRLPSQRPESGRTESVCVVGRPLINSKGVWAENLSRLTGPSSGTVHSPRRRGHC
jgi:hypothetical protein